MSPFPSLQPLARDLGFFVARCLLLSVAALPAVGLCWLGVFLLGPWGALLGLPFFPALWLLGLLLTVRLGAMCLRMPERGVYDGRREPDKLERVLRQLRRRDVLEASIIVFGLQRWLSAWPSLQRAYLRAAGGRIGDVAIAREVEICLPSLMRLGDGAYVGWGCTLWGVLQVSSWRLMVAPVEIGACAFVGYRCTLGPGARVGDQCVIGPFSLLSHGVRLGSEVFARGYLRAAPGAEIGGRSMLGYSVNLHDSCSLGFGCRIGHHVTIGRNAQIGDDVKLGDHVVVGAGAQVRSGTVVPAGTQIPRLTTWPV